MDNWLLIGRIIFSLMFIASGLGHWMDQEGSTGYAQGRGIANAPLMVQVSGTALLAGGVGILLGIWTDLAFLGIAVLVMVIAFMAHAFWKEQDAGTKQMEMSHFMKNLTMAGGALMGFAIYGSGYDLKQLVGPIGLLD